MEFTPEQIEKIKNFKWDDVDEKSESESEIESQPGSFLAEDILDCSQTLIKYVIDNICLSHYENGRFAIPIPVDIHPLIGYRYDNHWSDDSRTKVFEVVKAVFFVNMENNKEILSNKINSSVFPKSATDSMISDWQSSLGLEEASKMGESAKGYKVKWCKLYDDPSFTSPEEEGSVIVEVEML